MTTDPVLQANDLSFSHVGRIAPTFESVSLRVARGEIVALLGESGCGKSSLLSVLSGLARPRSGSVSFNDRHVLATPHGISVVFQDPCLLPWLSVAANAGLGLDFNSMGLNKAERDSRVASALAEVGLSTDTTLYPEQLSGGMAQRVALARALARQPELIFLDEPFSALDALTREDMQSLLVQLVHKHGSSAIIVTHDIDEALRVSDRILLMGGAPAGIVGEWQLTAVLGEVPRKRYTPASLQLRDEIIAALSSDPTPVAENAPAAFIVSDSFTTHHTMEESS